MIRFGLVCCLLSLAATATAQDHSPLFADRPDFTESAAITDRGRIRFEGGWTAQGDDRLSAHAFGAVVRSGIFDRWEAWVEATWYAVDDARGAEVSGRGDADLGLKLLLVDQAARVPATALLVSSSVPIGDDGIGERGWQPEARLLFEWASSTWSLGVNGGGGLPVLGGERFVQALGAVSLGRSLGSGAGAFAEAYAVLPADPDGRAVAYAGGGLGFALGAETGVDLRAGVGLVEASSDWLCAVEFTQEWVP
jgi:hypothetical protein